MQIAFFTYFINHHQVWVADQLDALTNHNYTFVETEPMPQSFKDNGYDDFTERSYLLQVWKSSENERRAMELAESADVVLYGTVDLRYLFRRTARTDKLTFVVNERWLKRGWLNLLSPRLLKFLWCYHTQLRKKPVYYLCSSAYGREDLNRMLMFKDRCYKWGYFTNVDIAGKLTSSAPAGDNSIRLMWCARFLAWKHPEMPVMLAARLRSKGYDINVDMFGSGEKLEDTKRLARQLAVNDIVHFCGNRPNEEILLEMGSHPIFLFTSDRREGWGAVANEAMSRGCILVCGDMIGSVPYLVSDGSNGCIFSSPAMGSGFGRCFAPDNDSCDSLCEKVEWLLQNRNQWQGISERAKKTMTEMWSPKVAAQNLLILIDDLNERKDTSIMDGPCSKA